MVKWVKDKLPILIVVFAVLVAGMALLKPGLPPTHDGEYHIIRFYEFTKAFLAGQLYPRWAVDLNNGFGLPIFTYVYPLPNYIALGLNILGFSFIDGLKANLLLATFIGAIGMFTFVKLYFGTKAGIVAAIFYIFAPYRLVDIYIRGSVGEVWALAFFPFFFLGTALLRNNIKKGFIISVLSLSAIIFSHNILAFIFAPVAFSWMFFLTNDSTERIKKLIKFSSVIFCSALISAVFWVPAIFEKDLVQGLEIYNVTDYFPELYQLLIPSWGTGFSGGGIGTEMSYQIGAVNLLVILIAFIAVGVSIFRRNEKQKVVLFFLGWILVLFLLMLRLSYHFWVSFPFMNYVQFPWRLLSLVIFFVSILSGFVSFYFRSIVLSVALIVILFLSTYTYIKPAYYHARSDSYYITRSNFIDGTNSVGNLFNTKWLKSIPNKQRFLFELSSGKGIVIDKRDQKVPTANVVIFSDAKIILQKAYFPGWIVSDNNNGLVINNINGKVSINLPRGNHFVQARFTMTQIQVVAVILSAVGVICCFVIYNKFID